MTRARAIRSDNDNAAAAPRRLNVDNAQLTAFVEALAIWAARREYNRLIRADTSET